MTFNYHSDKLPWHTLLNSFMGQSVDAAHQSPFFWWLIDHRIYDISPAILAEQLKLYMAACAVKEA